MDIKSKVLFVVVAILVMLSVMATFYKTVALEDFVVVYEEEVEELISEEDVSEESEVLDSPEPEGDLQIEDTGNEESLE